MRSSKTNRCGHPERKYYAKGKCSQCYQADYGSVRYALPERKAYIRAYNSQPEIKARKARYDATRHDYRKTHDAKPTTRARKFARVHRISYETVLPWMQILQKDRTCWLCGGTGATALDHNHETLHIRGWAHRICNLAEGYALGSPNPNVLLHNLQKVLDQQTKYAEMERGPRQFSSS